MIPFFLHIYDSGRFQLESIEADPSIMFGWLTVENKLPRLGDSHSKNFGSWTEENA